MNTLATPDFSSAPLTLHLFGPFEVSVNGAPLPRLRSLKGQWLLALLALHANQEVERAWLTALLWPDSAERAAFANLRCSLKDLRRALGSEAPRLHSPTVRTLRLDLTGAWVDVLAFDAAIARGDAASREEAMALYRGPLLGWRSGPRRTINSSPGVKPLTAGFPPGLPGRYSKQQDGQTGYSPVLPAGFFGVSKSRTSGPLSIYDVSTIWPC